MAFKSLETEECKEVQNHLRIAAANFKYGRAAETSAALERLALAVALLDEAGLPLPKVKTNARP